MVYLTFLHQIFSKLSFCLLDFIKIVWLLFASVSINGLFIFSSLIDIYVCCVSYTHQIAAKNFFLVLVSTTVETANPEAELKPGLDLLGTIKDK